MLQVPKKIAKLSRRKQKIAIRTLVKRRLLTLVRRGVLKQVAYVDRVVFKNRSFEVDVVLSPRPALNLPGTVMTFCGEIQ